MTNENITANYQYWQECGNGWAKEYDSRKKNQALYHIQEIMLADYMIHSAPARVLEFGCGVGRHLKYLKEIPGLELYGYDQSPTMLFQIADWAEPNWMRDHIVLGEPLGRLPYADGSFDIVYTAEVLIHVCPQDISSILAEFIRVAKWQVFHLEPAKGYNLDSNAHEGCWFHDFVKEYDKLGEMCEVLPQGYAAQSPYRVLLDPSRPVYSTSPIIISLLKRLEDDLRETIIAGWQTLNSKQELCGVEGKKDK